MTSTENRVGIPDEKDEVSAVDKVAALGGNTSFLSSSDPNPSHQKKSHHKKNKVIISGLDEKAMSILAHKRSKELFVGRVLHDESPTNKYIRPVIMIWNFVVLGSIFITAWLILFTLGFRPWSSINEPDDPSNRVPWLIYFCDSIFFVDALAEFRRPVLDTTKGIMIIKPLFIIRRYITFPRGAFWLNMLALAPFELMLPVTSYDEGGDDDDGMFGNSLNRRLRELVLLVRLLRLIRIKNILQRQAADIAAFPPHWIALVRLICLICGLSHLFACAWSFCGDIEFLRYDQRQPSALPAAGWKHAFTQSYSDVRHAHYPHSKWGWYFVCLNIGAGFAVGARPLGDVAKPTTNLEHVASSVMTLVGAASSCYMMVEIWRIVTSMNKWYDRYTSQLSEMNLLLANNNISHGLRRRLRQHVFRSMEIVRMREGRASAFSALSPSLQAQMVLADGEETWIRSVWWLRNSSAAFLLDLSKGMVPELYTVGEKITRKRTLFVIGRFGIVARNGRVHVPGMVWGEDIIITNEVLIDTNHAISLAYSEVYMLTLEVIKKCLANHSGEISMFRRSAAKCALVRGVRKIAKEIKARRSRTLSANDYVNTLLHKFDGDLEPEVDPELLVYHPGENQYLDKAMHVLGVKYKQDINSQYQSNTISSQMSSSQLAQMEENVKVMSQAMDRKFESLNSQNQSSINEMRHMAKIFNDVLLTHQGLVQSFRAQVGTTIARSTAHTGIGTSTAPPGFGSNPNVPSSRSRNRASPLNDSASTFMPFTKPPPINAITGTAPLDGTFGGAETGGGIGRPNGIMNQNQSRSRQRDVPDYELPPDTMNQGGSMNTASSLFGQVTDSQQSGGVQNQSAFSKVPPRKQNTMSPTPEAGSMMENMLSKAAKNNNTGADAELEEKLSTIVDGDQSASRLRRRVEESLGLEKPPPRMSVSESRPSSSSSSSSSVNQSRVMQRPSSSSRNRRSISPLGPPPPTGSRNRDEELKEEQFDSSGMRSTSVRPPSRSPNTRNRPKSKIGSLFNNVDDDIIDNQQEEELRRNTSSVQTTRKSSGFAAASKASSRNSVGTPPQLPDLSGGRGGGKRFSSMLIPMQSSAASYRNNESFKETLLSKPDGSRGGQQAVEMPKLQSHRQPAPRSGYESSLHAAGNSSIL